MWERQSYTRSRGRTARVHGPRGFAARAVDAAVLPSSLCRIVYFFPKTMNVERVRADLLQAYEVDLPEAEHLAEELRVWKTKRSSVLSEMKVRSTVEDTLKSVSGQELLFPNVLQVLKLLLVTPVTTTSVERANSTRPWDSSSQITETRCLRVECTAAPVCPQGHTIGF